MKSEQDLIEENNYPKDKYNRTDYTFTRSELSLINTYEAIKKMGEMASSLIKDLINRVCIPRVGHTSEKEIGIYYLTTEGIFSVYTPKAWCSLCKKKAGFNEFEKQPYCDRCLPLAQLREDVVSKNGKTIQP